MAPCGSPSLRRARGCFARLELQVELVAVCVLAVSNPGALSFQLPTSGNLRAQSQSTVSLSSLAGFHRWPPTPLVPILGALLGSGRPQERGTTSPSRPFHTHTSGDVPCDATRCFALRTEQIRPGWVGDEGSIDRSKPSFKNDARSSAACGRVFQPMHDLQVARRTEGCTCKVDVYCLCSISALGGIPHWSPARVLLARPGQEGGLHPASETHEAQRRREIRTYFEAFAKMLRKQFCRERERLLAFGCAVIPGWIDRIYAPLVSV